VRNMPLFGPDIKKMKEHGDIQGLIKELQNKKYEVRIDVVKALSELKCIEGLVKALENDMPGVRLAAVEALKETGDYEGMTYASDILIQMLKYGTDEDKIEALTRICGRSNSLFLTCWLGPTIADVLKNVVKSKLPLELVREALLVETAGEKVHPVVRWYALIALVELGERSQGVLDELIKISDELVTFYDRKPDPDEDSFAIAGRTFLAYSIKDETLRAISCFKGNPTATYAIIEALEGNFLAGRSKGEPSFDDKRILSALGALGDPATRERLGYLASYGDVEAKRLAKVALEYFGRATYDEIKAKAEANR